MSVPPKQSKSSKILSVEENSFVFSLLGKNCLSQCTAVAELFTADPPQFSYWNRFGMGVLCFVKDSEKRSYFMRLYCLRRKQTIWEHEIYDELTCLQPRPYLIMFEGQPSIICLNFASEAEADKFSMLLQRYLQNRQKKIIARQSVRRPAPSMFLDQSVVKEIPDVIIGQKEKVRQRRGIKKEDIGKPSNFVHLESGSRDNRLRHLLENTSENNGRDKRLSKFLDEAGVTPRMLNNRKTREAVRSFIEENQVLKKIQGDPVAFQRPAPSVPPIPPRPRSKHDAPVPPPPPPVPLNFTDNLDIQLPPIGENETYASSYDKPDFLSEIQKGKELKPVQSQIQIPSVNDGRCDLLLDIQRGIQLKSVKARREDSPMPKEETHDLARAMHKALNVILVANHNSSDEEVDSSFDNWDE